MHGDYLAPNTSQTGAEAERSGSEKPVADKPEVGPGSDRIAELLLGSGPVSAIRSPFS